MQEGERWRARAEQAQPLWPGSRVSPMQRTRLTRPTHGQRRSRASLRIGGHRLRGGGRSLQ